MRRFYLLLSLTLMMPLPPHCFADIAIDTRISIKPGNSDEAAMKLVKQTEHLQGYFVTRSNERVELKVPSQSANELQKFIEQNWLIYQQDYQANDITVQLIETKSNLKAKEELLDEYQKILATTPSDKLFKVSTSVTNLVQQIELLRGRLNYLQHQLRYARYTVVFQLDRGAVDSSRVVSSFPWLNSMGLPNLLSDFSQ